MKENKVLPADQGSDEVMGGRELWVRGRVSRGCRCLEHSMSIACLVTV